MNGMFAGLSPTGALLLQTTTGTQNFTSADVQEIPLPGPGAQRQPPQAPPF